MTATASTVAVPSVVLTHTAKASTVTTWVASKAAQAIGTFGKALMAEWFARKADGRVPHLAANRKRRIEANYLRGHATESDLLQAEAALAEAQAWQANLVRVVKGLDLTKPVGNRADGSAITLDTVVSMVFAPETGAQAEKACREALAAK